MVINSEMRDPEGGMGDLYRVWGTARIGERAARRKT